MNMSKITLPAGFVALAIGLLWGHAFAQPVSVPRDKIVADPAETVLLTLHATGDQIYTCMEGGDGTLSWVLSEPRARLRNGRILVGRHYAGPTWEHSDGSRVKGQPIARADAAKPGAIPWLRLTVTERSGQGILSGASAILRVNTSGGVRSGPCKRAGARHRQAYSSDYIFLGRN